VDKTDQNLKSKMTKAELLHKAIKGDAKSISAIVEQYTPLVHKIVSKYAFMAPRHSREDLVQEGLIGVVKALRTFEPERGYQFMTWVYPQVRGAVSGFARRENKNPKYPLSLEQSDWAHNLEDPSVYEVKDDKTAELVKELLLIGCGNLENKQAQIVCDRFGLLGKTAMRQGDVARKYGLTKQAVQSYLARFHRKVRTARPELAGLI
jgi:RNA polymerase sporulation-specific sigma factor